MIRPCPIALFFESAAFKLVVMSAAQSFGFLKLSANAAQDNRAITFSAKLPWATRIIPNEHSAFLARNLSHLLSVMRLAQSLASFRLTANRADGASPQVRMKTPPFMNFGVLRPRHQFQVFNSIVGSVFVSMMDKLSLLEFSTKVRLHYKPMFLNIFSRSVRASHHDITGFCNMFSTFPIRAFFGMLLSPFFPTRATPSILADTISSALCTTRNTNIAFRHAERIM